MMEKLVKPARIAFCIGLAGMVIPQLFYGVFGDNFLPAWPHLPLVPLWSGIFTLLVLAACVAILINKWPKAAALLLGGLLLAVYILGYFTYDAFLAQYNNHLGTWGDGLKETALSGGLFVAAASLPDEPAIHRSALLRFLERLIPFGPFLFCLTMVLYGISHLLYTKFIAPLVPDWIPGHTFWTIFAGVALILSGIAITLKIKLKTVAFLLGLMIFIWLFIIHIPRAIHDPYGANSNEPVSAFSALAFCATAFMISGMATKKQS